MLCSCSNCSLYVIQGLCEGHNCILQNYLHSQPDNVTEYNLVLKTVQFLNAVRDEYGSATASNELIFQLLETLVELAQGNPRNQKDLFDAHLIDCLNVIMRLGNRINTAQTSLAKQGQSAQLSCHDSVQVIDEKIAQLIESLLTSSTEATAHIPAELNSILDFDAMIAKMVTYTQHSRNLRSEDGTAHLYDDEGVRNLHTAFAFYTIVAKLSEMTGRDYYAESEARARLLARRRPGTSSSSDINDGKRQHRDEVMFPKKLMTTRDALKMLKDLTGTVEVVHNGKMVKTYFPVDAGWKDAVTKKIKNELNWALNRTSTADGVKHFTTRAKAIIAGIKHQRMLMNYWPLSILLRSAVFLDVFIDVLSFSMVLYMLALWQAPLGLTYTAEPNYAEEWQSTLFTALGVVHVTVACLLTLHYFVLNPPFTNKNRRKNKMAVGQQADLLSESNLFSSVLMAAHEAQDDQKQQGLREFQTLFKKQAEVSLLIESRAEHHVDLIDRLVHLDRHEFVSQTTFYKILFLVASVSGLFSWGYTFAFHLLHIVEDNQTMTRVLKSVTKNGGTLLYVALLIVILIFFFSLFVFGFMRENMDRDEGLYCHTLFQCFVTSMRFGLLEGGGLGFAIPTKYESFNDAPLWRVIFDLLFFALVTTIGLNVVFGVIVDTFQELRDEKYATAQKMATECFFCGLNSDVFDTTPGGSFKTHETTEHNMWSYLYFFAHLDAKPMTEFSAIEQDVAIQLSKGSIAFYPIGRALSVNHGSLANDAADRLEDRVSRLQAAHEAMRESVDLKVDSVERKVDALLSMLKSLRAPEIAPVRSRASVSDSSPPRPARHRHTLTTATATSSYGISAVEPVPSARAKQAVAATAAATAEEAGPPVYPARLLQREARNLAPVSVPASLSASYSAAQIESILQETDKATGASLP